jgi:hypothetical protein
MAESIQGEYERRRAAFEGEFHRTTERSSTMTMWLLAALAGLAYALYEVIHNGQHAWWVLTPLVALAIIVPQMLRARSASQRAMRLLDVYERGLARVDGSMPQSGHTGEAFHEEGHVYERDLNILGPDSIFGLLATTRTAVGERALAGLLLHGADTEVVRKRQAAVRELAPMLDLREHVAMLGRSAFDELPAESFDRWLDHVDDGFSLWMRFFLIALTLVWMGWLVAALMHFVEVGTMLRNLEAVLAAEGAFALWLRPKVMAEMAASQRLSGQTAILRNGLKLLREQKFDSEILQQMQRDAAGDEGALKSLSRSLTLVEQRAKEWFYAPAMLLAVGTHAAISLDAWKRKHGGAMRKWVATWAEFEALLAVATYAAEHSENVYPKIVENGPATFIAKQLAHPLLPPAQAIANDVKLDADTRFLLISGSNMAGKSTLLRSVGCNTVLALAGAPVCARTATMSSLRVGASLALVDSLAEGKSKFLAEVERLRDIVALAKTGNGLFLIDEIFSGTNSADRRAAAEAVLRALMREGAIGALSTHDLALAELAEMPGLGGRNVHMASPDESDPLGFDYLLKPGVNRTTNALAIVKMLGLG